MKAINRILFSFLLLSSFTLMAQSPGAFNYQAVIRNNSGVSISNQAVTMDFKIRQGSINGIVVYHEQHAVNTDSRGLIALQVGNGTALLGNIKSINWNTGLYFLETSVDRGSGLTLMGTSQLVSVPFAFHANTADSLIGGVSVVEMDPVFNASLAGSITTLDTTRWGTRTVDTQIDSGGIAAYGFVAGAISSEVDGDTTNELQSLTSSSNATNRVISITGGSGTTIDVADNDNDSNNEIQILSISNDTIFLSNGGFAKLPPPPQGFDGSFNSLTNVPLHLDIDSTNDFNGSFTSLSNVPTGLSDGDDDTQLSQNQVLSFVANDGYIKTEIDGDVTNEIQVISKSGNTVSLNKSGGSFIDEVNDADSDVTNELQTLSISGNNLSISGKNTISIPSSPWTISGSNIYRLTGNVSIGTSSTSTYKLRVSGTSLFTGAMSIEDDLSIDQFIDHVGDPNSYFGFSSNDNWNLFLNGQEKVAANSNSFELKVRDIRMQDIPATSVLASSDSIVVINSSGYLKSVPQSSLVTSSPSLWSSSGSNVYRNSGRVGIGTSNPSYDLDVDGDIRVATNLYFQNGSHNTKIFRSGHNLYVNAPDGSVYLNSTFLVKGSNGYVGLGVFSPSYRLTLPNATGNSGRAQASAWLTYSDNRIKSNQSPIPYGLEDILKLNPKVYHKHSSSLQNGKLEIATEFEKELGLIAQEVYQVIPEIVSVPENPEELWALDYEKIVPVLIKAIQEQQKQIDALLKGE